jgi:membrane-bound lytic murein transglycosylase B
MMSVLLRSLLLACLLCSVLPVADAAKAPSKRRVAAEPDNGLLYARRDDVMRLAGEIAERRGLDPDWVRSAIGQSRHLPQVARWVLPAASPTAKNWRVYRSRFIDPVRIRAGVAFWEANARELARAEQVYGVPAEIIVGIIGVETIYGRNTGNFRVMDALSTLAFDFPQAHPRAAERRAFFQGELEQLLSLAHRASNDPMGYKGSYAGAMGMPQFMPSSWVRYAIDFDGDGRIDLFDSSADVIGSVANYFQSFGWQKGMPTHYPVQFDKSRLDLEALLAPDILPTFNVDSFTAKGAVLDAAGMRHAGPLALVELFNGDAAPSYVAGTENFYVITRYNWSSYYALAVIELGQEVAAARGR